MSADRVRELRGAGRWAEAKEYLERARELAEQSGATAFLRRVESVAAEHDL